MMQDNTTYTALIAGASGVVGADLLNLLLRGGRYHSVIALVRKPLTIQHEFLHQIITDFNDLSDIPAAEHVFCCVGSTMAKAGSRAAFEAVDFEIPVTLATTAANQGAAGFMVVSAMGANAQSRIFYNRVKGKMEQAVLESGIASVRIFRPGLLMAPRAEKRRGEQLAQKVFSWLNPLLPVAWRGVPARNVAFAMYQEALHLRPGVRIINNAEMVQITGPFQSIFDAG
jgi:uncharacterized protein YbjT (DUF2867 family)